MKQIFLLGNPGTKRTLYLERAARQAGLSVLLPGESKKASHAEMGAGCAEGIRLLDWNDWPRCLPSQNDGRVFLKIDPPVWQSSFLDQLEELTQSYKERLSVLDHMAQYGEWEFLNHPKVILALLDKRGCKETLIKAGLPVTEGLGEGLAVLGHGNSLDESSAVSRRREEEPDKLVFALSQAEIRVEGLLEAMRKHHRYQVFIKPLNGSGAAGVAAFRWQPKTGRMALYTCAAEAPDGRLVNTKRLRCFQEKNQVVSLLGPILELGCIVERWYAKADYQGNSYDLRVVVQDGRQDFLLARLSRGPITNLHLNNRPLEASLLGLPEGVREAIFDLCKRAMECFPGLRSAGIDVLLEKGSLKPRIIEMNAQGDLLYQDIYHNNLIYRHQVEMMKRWKRQ